MIDNVIYFTFTPVYQYFMKTLCLTENLPRALLLASEFLLSFLAVHGPQQPDVYQKPPGQTNIQSAEHPEVHRLQWNFLDASHCFHALQVFTNDWGKSYCYETL